MLSFLSGFVLSPYDIVTLSFLSEILPLFKRIALNRRCSSAPRTKFFMRVSKRIRGIACVLV